MAVTILMLPIVILAVLLCIAIPVFLGVFVYQDAKARGMEPLLWAVIAVLAPSFIGLIIYLVVRRDHVVLSCPNCGGEVQESFTSCPQCGQKLSANCGHCGAALRPEWKICPQCGTEITEAEPFNPPVINQGASSKKLLAVVVAILLIPVVLMMIAIFGYAAVDHVTNGAATDELDNARTHLAVEAIQNLPDYEEEEYKVLTLKQANLGEDAEKWVKECKEGKKGIYSRTFYRPKSGSFNSAKGSGTYNMTYAYTVIVMNDDAVYDCKGGVSYMHSGEEEFLLPEDIEQELIEVVSAEEIEQAKEYGNVFVLRFPSSYDIDFTFTGGGITENLSAEMESESLDLTVISDAFVNGNHISTTYSIPFDGDCYQTIQKAEITITEKED